MMILTGEEQSEVLLSLMAELFPFRRYCDSQRDTFIPICYEKEGDLFHASSIKMVFKSFLPFQPFACWQYPLQENRI